MRSMLFAAFFGAIVWAAGHFLTWPPSLFGYSMAASSDKRRDEFRYFFNELKLHGQWRRNARYGWIWMPRVSRRWRPYTAGRWVHTSQYGWVWDSHEPFGAIVYHYGWWDRDLNGLWFWVPGYTWAPAWVVWKVGPTHIGWAPFPPARVWGRSWRLALSQTWPSAYAPSPHEWCFVEARKIASPFMLLAVLPVEENTKHVEESATIQTVTVVNRTIVNRGVDIAGLERDHGVKVDDADTNSSSALAGKDLRIMQPFGGEAQPLDSVVLGSPDDAVPASEIDAANAAEAAAAESRAPPPYRRFLDYGIFVHHDHEWQRGAADAAAPTRDGAPH